MKARLLAAVKMHKHLSIKGNARSEDGRQPSSLPKTAGAGERCRLSERLAAKAHPFPAKAGFYAGQIQGVSIIKACEYTLVYITLFT